MILVFSNILFGDAVVSFVQVCNLVFIDIVNCDIIIINSEVGDVEVNKVIFKVEVGNVSTVYIMIAKK